MRPAAGFGSMGVVAAGVQFTAIEEDGLLDILHHPNQEKYPGQRILVVCLRDYVYLVPFVEEADFYFLKTIIPSRKATRDYLGGDNSHEKD